MSVKNLQVFDIIVIDGKDGVYFVKQPMQPLYDCGNGYREHQATVEPFSLSAGGVFGDAFPVYISDIGKVGFASDLQIQAS